MRRIFQKKPIAITAEQFEGDPKQRGVCMKPCLPDGQVCRAHVHTMHAGQTVALKLGDWVVPEPDGIHFYPIDNEVFWKTYEEIT